MKYNPQEHKKNRKTRLAIYAQIKSIIKYCVKNDEHRRELVTFLNKQIAREEKRKELYKDKLLEKHMQATADNKNILMVLTDDYQTIAEITEKLQALGSPLTLRQISYHLGHLLQSGAVVKKLIKLPNKHKYCVYRLKNEIDLLFEDDIYIEDEWEDVEEEDENI